MNKLNLPPFYIGQKVEYIGHIIRLKGTKHIVLNCFKAECGCWCVETNNLPYGFFTICNGCGKPDKKSGKIGKAISFIPLEEMNAPLLTFQQIKEKEKEEILILN